MMKALQFREETKTRAEASEMAKELGRQDGILSTRVTGDGVRKSFAVQALFEIDGHDPEWLPDGMRIVLVPASFPLTLSI